MVRLPFRQSSLELSAALGCNHRRNYTGALIHSNPLRVILAMWVLILRDSGSTLAARPLVITDQLLLLTRSLWGGSVFFARSTTPLAPSNASHS
jgi:hypothetical protein